MMLAFQARQTTKDVDAIFAPAREIREAAKLVAQELALEEDWLNDAAKGFLSPQGEFVEAPLPAWSNLRVLAPTPQYMLAMKVMAARLETGPDKEDITLLVNRLGLSSAPQALEIVLRYYDESKILPRSVYVLDEIFEEKGRK